MTDIIIKATCNPNDTAWEVPAHLVRDIQASEFIPFYGEAMEYLASLLTEEYINQILPYMNFDKLSENVRVACYVCILRSYSPRIAALSLAADILGFVQYMKSSNKVH